MPAGQGVHSKAPALENVSPVQDCTTLAVEFQNLPAVATQEVLPGALVAPVHLVQSPQELVEAMEYSFCPHCSHLLEIVLKKLPGSHSHDFLALTLFLPSGQTLHSVAPAVVAYDVSLHHDTIIPVAFQNFPTGAMQEELPGALVADHTEQFPQEVLSATEKRFSPHCSHALEATLKKLPASHVQYLRNLELNLPAGHTVHSVAPAEAVYEVSLHQNMRFRLESQYVPANAIQEELPGALVAPVHTFVQSPQDLLPGMENIFCPH